MIRCKIFNYQETVDYITNKTYSECIRDFVDRFCISYDTETQILTLRDSDDTLDWDSSDMVILTSEDFSKWENIWTENGELLR